jgi:hypothetical protein
VRVWCVTRKSKTLTSHCGAAFAMPPSDRFCLYQSLYCNLRSESALFFYLITSPCCLPYGLVFTPVSNRSMGLGCMTNILSLIYSIIIGTMSFCFF